MAHLVWAGDYVGCFEVCAVSCENECWREEEEGGEEGGGGEMHIVNDEDR